MNADHSSMRKSLTGLPQMEFFPGLDLKREASKARRRLYPVSVLYSAYAAIVVALALRAGASVVSVLAWFLAGVAAWTYLEYLAHRYVLHGVFPDGPGRLRHWLHERFDHLHWTHHRNPWDGDHINGTIRDTLPFTLPAVALGFLAPVYTAPVLLGGLLVSYIAEEWVHQSVHFYNFKGRYFRYIKRHHLYHHSPRGAGVAFGLSNGIWDVLIGTRIPATAREILYPRRRAA